MKNETGLHNVRVHIYAFIFFRVKNRVTCNRSRLIDLGDLPGVLSTRGPRDAKIKEKGCRRIAAWANDLDRQVADHQCVPSFDLRPLCVHCVVSVCFSSLLSREIMSMCPDGGQIYIAGYRLGTQGPPARCVYKR